MRRSKRGRTRSDDDGSSNAGGVIEVGGTRGGGCDGVQWCVIRVNTNRL
jgi:hypothetical protein